MPCLTFSVTPLTALDVLPLEMFLSAQAVCAFLWWRAAQDVRAQDTASRSTMQLCDPCRTLTEPMCFWLWEGFLLAPCVMWRGLKAVEETCVSLYLTLLCWEGDNRQVLQSQASNEASSVQPRKAPPEHKWLRSLTYLQADHCLL